MSTRLTLHVVIRTLL